MTVLSRVVCLQLHAVFFKHSLVKSTGMLIQVCGSFVTDSVSQVSSISFSLVSGDCFSMDSFSKVSGKSFVRGCLLMSVIAVLSEAILVRSVVSVLSGVVLVRSIVTVLSGQYK